MASLWCARDYPRSQSSSPMDSSSSGSTSVLSTPSSISDGCSDNCRLFQEYPQEDQKEDAELLAEAEKLIAKDLTLLSHKEREEALFDIHGVAEISGEEESTISQSKLDLEADLLRNMSSSPAFMQAWNESPSYVRGMYLMFLRADEFNIKRASNRVRLHFDTKLWLFGRHTLCRDITLADFDYDDMVCYNSGLFQVLPVRDRAGRAICIKLWALQGFDSRENVWRQIWYNHMVMLQDEETQIKGIVQIVYNVVDNWVEKFDKDLLMGVGRIRAATPIRVVSVHYCFNDASFGAIIKTVSLALELHTRTRTRLHYGSHVEVQYELQGFGIPVKTLPVNCEGKIRTKEHLAWVRTRQMVEGKLPLGSNNSQIVVPTHRDVLFGRGKSLQSHFGNMRFANVLEELMEDYVTAKRQGKVSIFMDVKNRLEADGSRFLRQDDFGVWEVVDEKTAIDKIGHGFRNRKTTPSKPAVQGDKRGNGNAGSGGEKRKKVDREAQ